MKCSWIQRSSPEFQTLIVRRQQVFGVRRYFAAFQRMISHKVHKGPRLFLFPKAAEELPHSKTLSRRRTLGSLTAAT